MFSPCTSPASIDFYPQSPAKRADISKHYFVHIFTTSCVSYQTTRIECPQQKVGGQNTTERVGGGFGFAGLLYAGSPSLARPGGRIARECPDVPGVKNGGSGDHNEVVPHQSRVLNLTVSTGLPHSAGRCRSVPMVKGNLVG